MKMIKSLILGSAAGLVVMSGAQAADLPVKAKAVEYVRICGLYGAGFYFIPGTDTCIKLSGYLRVDVLANTNSDASGNLSGAGGAQNRFTNAFTWRSREDFDIDTRTATEYGTVRTFFDATFSWTDDTYTGNGVAPGSTIYSAVGGGPGVSAGGNANNATSGAVAGGTLGVYYAFIQFAGFTMGKAISPFSAPWQNYPGNSFDGLVGGGGTVTGVNQFTYDFQFGGGVSGTISAVDPTQYYQAGNNNIAAGGPFGTNDVPGTSVPDFQGKLAIDQAWGLFQVTAAGHNNHAGYYSGPAGIGGTELANHPDDKFGYAVGAALQIKNIPTGAGDVINIQGVYTKGATRYDIQDLSSAGASTYFSGTNVPGAYQSVGFGIAPDSVFGAIGGVNTSQQLVETYGMRGGYTHNWDPYWNSSIYGAYAAIRYNGTSQTLICGTAGVGGSFRATYGAGVIGCNPDYNIAQIGLVTRWTPVKNLAFIADLTYQHLDQNMTGTATFGSAGIGKPTAVYAFKDQDAVSLLLRAQRNW